MGKHFQEFNTKTFCIDLICEEYKTNNPIQISKLCDKILEEKVSVSQVIDYLNMTEDYEKESKTVKMKDIFYE